jgi:rfaE bifunctional protein nucleotidyltransferase chain/domain
MPGHALDDSAALAQDSTAASPKPADPPSSSACWLLLDALCTLRAAWSETGERVVLTNGCFDLLHSGHVRYLAAARALGDRLVVALNDDLSTQSLKGPGRPILPLAERAELLCALRVVDAVVAFGAPTAVEIVRALRPDIYVKGGDYGHGANRPPEADAAEAIGARVAFLPFVEGRSTSAIIAHIHTLGESA